MPNYKHNRKLFEQAMAEVHERDANLKNLYEVVHANTNSNNPVVLNELVGELAVAAGLLAPLGAWIYQKRKEGKAAAEKQEAERRKEAFEREKFNTTTRQAEEDRLSSERRAEADRLSREKQAEADRRSKEKEGKKTRKSRRQAQQQAIIAGTTRTIAGILAKNPDPNATKAALTALGSLVRGKRKKRKGGKTPPGGPTP